MNGGVHRRAGEKPTGFGASMPKATAPVDRAAFANVAAGHRSALDPGRPVASMQCGFCGAWRIREVCLLS